ncbi:MAG: Protein of unknown function rane [Firmicutes bacterium]|nr:Protein of unknown function rane [Bacillota bacterium]
MMIRNYLVDPSILQTLRNQKGATAVLVALSVIVICGMAALVMDVGLLYVNKYQLANAADSAALAGAQDLPGNYTQAKADANTYANLNGKKGDIVQVTVANDNTSVTVTISRKVPLFFANIWNESMANVTATTTAQVKTFSGGNIGIVPFGIVKQNLVFGKTYKLKVGAGSGFDGNFQALALGGTGASVYLYNLKYGYKGTFHIGDWISTETGNISGPTSQGIAYRINLDPTATFDTVQNNSGRIVVSPIIDSFAVNGSSNVQVVGFAAFFLEGNANQGSDSYVYGKFRQMVLPGDISTSATNYGLNHVVLTN